MSMGREPIAIEARDVVKRFGETTAVNHVSLQVRKGEFVAFLGPSGCGKTTLLRMLGGLEFPNEGRIFLEGKDVTQVPAHGRKTNMIFQQLALFPHMDVYHNIAYGLKVQNVPRVEIRRRVAAVLDLVQLSGYADRAVAQLSGGQAQRVAIARALINEPDVLLLDEPLSALDMQLRLDMQRELKRIQRESGSTFIFVTHDQQEALNMSDRIGVMRGGVLLQYGSPDDIFERPADSFVAKFIGDTNLLPVTVAEAREEQVTVTWQDRTLQALSHHRRPALREEGHLSIRYEYVAIGEEAAVLANRLQARIEDIIYGGTTIRYLLRTSSGAALTANRHHHPGGTRYAVGEQVEIGWRTEDALYLPNGEGLPS